MKKLVLGVLLAVVASSTGCIISSSSGSNDAQITARWSFTHLATNSAGQCASASDMAVIMAQPWDPATQTLLGGTHMAPFNCDDGQGSVLLPDIYRVWVEIQTGTGQVLAQSDETFIDTLDGDQSIAVGFYDDGGYFEFSWDLVSKATQSRVSCAAAGITSTGSVEIISTSIANKQYFKDDKYTCDDHFGTTAPLLADTYTISIDAEQGGAIGDPTNLTNKLIVANQITDLGNIKISVP